MNILLQTGRTKVKKGLNECLWCCEPFYARDKQKEQVPRCVELHWDKKQSGYMTGHAFFAALFKALVVLK